MPMRKGRLLYHTHLLKPTSISPPQTLTLVARDAPVHRVRVLKLVRHRDGVPVHRRARGGGEALGSCRVECFRSLAPSHGHTTGTGGRLPGQHWGMTTKTNPHPHTYLDHGGEHGLGPRLLHALVVVAVVGCWWSGGCGKRIKVYVGWSGGGVCGMGEWWVGVVGLLHALVVVAVGYWGVCVW